MATPSAQYTPTNLYGGAITVDLPSTFGDASKIRQIPDHQEVFLDNNGYSSIVFEILERVEKSSDEEALQYHFQDLVDGTGDATNMLNQGRTSMTKLPNIPVLALSFIQTPQPDPKGRKLPEYVAIHLLLVRLKEQNTDIMVAVNTPHYTGEYEKAEVQGQPTRLMRDGEEVTKRIAETFEVREWGLFEG